MIIEYFLSFFDRCHKEDFFAPIQRIVLICADAATFMHAIVVCSVLAAVNASMTPPGLEISSNVPIKIKPIFLSSYLWMLHNFIWMETIWHIFLSNIFLEDKGKLISFRYTFIYLVNF